MPARIDERLKEWATPIQIRYIDATNEYGSERAAARAMGVNKSAIGQAIRAARGRAAMAGYAPSHDMTRAAPSPFVVKGVSTYYNKEGAVSGQWVKTALDSDKKEEAIRVWVDSLIEGARGLSPSIQTPDHVYGDLLCVYPMGDPHFGMYSWRAETGDDYDLALAERLTLAAIDRLVDAAPAAETAIIAELGDFFHMDSTENRTGKSGNSLDVDSRWAKVMQVGLRAMVHVVKRALEKHRRVIVRIVKGNHDPHSHFALALALDAFFSNNERVKVDLSPAAFWFHRFGKVLIGVAHGDTTKMPDLPGIMACDRPEDWGLTKYRYWYQGHIHHEETREFPGCVVEAFRTLAARDAWHAGEGYRAGRDMRCIVLHKEYGEIERHRCDIAMVDTVPVAPAWAVSLAHSDRL